MKAYDIILNGIVILGLFYLAFVMALAGWFAGLQKGEAVTLLPEDGGRTSKTWIQAGFVLVSLAVSILFMYFLWIPLPFSISPAAADVLKACGLALFLGGLALTFWARQTLGAMWGISTSRKVKLLPDHQLIQGGPYAWVRHPMYLGWWVSLTGLLMIYRTWILLVMLIMSLVIFYRRARLEERVLAEKFGKEWETYTRRCKFLIPFIH